MIRERTDRNLDDPAARFGWNTHLPYRPKRLPLLELERQLAFSVEHSHDTATVLIDAVFLILLTLLGLTRDEREGKQSFRPLSPTVRMELTRFDRIHAQYMLLRENDIHTAEDLGAFMGKRQGEITALEKERQSCRNRLRRPKDPQVERNLKERIHGISEQLRPLRKDLATARRIDDSWRRDYELLQSEHDLEAQARTRERIWKAEAGTAWEKSDYVFTDELGHHLKTWNVDRCFKRAVEAIGLPNTRFHDLRHSYAVAAIRSGDDIKTVQENLGHATAAFTLDVYGHVTDRMKQESAKRMDRFISQIMTQ